MLENDILPTLRADDFQLVTFHCHFESQTPGAHTQQFGLTYPMALDFDSELFRRFRLPGHVFPLNIVIDREGNLAHVGTDLDETVMVAEQLLAQ